MVVFIKSETGEAFAFEASDCVDALLLASSEAEREERMSEHFRKLCFYSLLLLILALVHVIALCAIACINLESIPTGTNDVVLIEIAELTAAAVCDGAWVGALAGLTVGGQVRATCTAASSIVGVEDEALGAAADEAVDRKRGFVSEICSQFMQIETFSRCSRKYDCKVNRFHIRRHHRMSVSRCSIACPRDRSN